MPSRDLDARFERSLADLCDGLTYVSETDAPVEPFFGGQVEVFSAASLAKALGVDTDSDIEVLEPEKFFDHVTAKRPWFTDIEAERAERFANLEDFLRTELRYLRLVRTGKIQIVIYIVGQTSDGTLAGVRTHAVET